MHQHQTDSYDLYRTILIWRLTILEPINCHIFLSVFSTFSSTQFCFSFISSSAVLARQMTVLQRYTSLSFYCLHISQNMNIKRQWKTFSVKLKEGPKLQRICILLVGLHLMTPFWRNFLCVLSRLSLGRVLNNPLIFVLQLCNPQVIWRLWSCNTSVEMCSKDILIIGPGVLGSRVATLWKQRFPQAQITLKAKRQDPEREAKWQSLGFICGSEKDVGHKYPNVLFSAPPTAGWSLS